MSKDKRSSSQFIYLVTDHKLQWLSSCVVQFGSGLAGRLTVRRKGKEEGGKGCYLERQWHIGATTCFPDEDALIVNGTAARLSAMTIFPGEHRQSLEDFLFLTQEGAQKQ